jgi:nucleoside-diphosphate-sugar epimerase
MESRRILLTGATGFLGKSIYKELNGRFNFLRLGRSVGNDIQVDLSKEIPKLTDRVDLIVHAAGKAHVIPSNLQEAKEFDQVNVVGTQNLILGIEQSGFLPAEFVFISSVAVYGKEMGNLLDETCSLLGSTPYAKSKIKAEQLLVDWCDKKEIRLTILRLPLLVGKNPPGNLGSMIRWMKRSLYVSIGSGQCRKSMVLVNDVAQFIPRVALIGGTYNLTDGCNPTMVELEEALAKQLGVRKPIRVPNKVISGFAKIGDLLGSWFPINSNVYAKLTNELTFSDEQARKLAGWSSSSVISNLSINV